MDASAITQEVSGDGGTPGERSTSRDLEQLASRVARSRLNVLITGEMGTGKAVLARRIHAASDRADRPLVILTCTGLRAGAIEQGEGVLAAADGGTLLLDGVDGLSQVVQAKLLRFLETGEIERTGTPVRPVDVRVLATTNRSLETEVDRGTFRAELLSRLDGVRFAVPPLREHREDIPALAASLLGTLCERESLSKPVITTAAFAALQRHGWPGNLRELRNVLERALWVCEGGRIEARDLMLPLSNFSTQLREPASPAAPDAPKPLASDPVKVACTSPWSALQPGAVVGGTYRIVRLIGSGGTGQVYEATHTRLNGRYAVKVLHPNKRRDARALARFQREAQIASGLQHPNIVAILDFDHSDDGMPYLAMEYVDGRELARVIADGAPLAIDRVLDIVDQIASALSVVHGRDIVHRDLKPENILLTPALPANREQVKLVDFGISKIHHAEVVMTGECAVLGTPQYMAPEQALGRDDIDVRADQFALAAIVHEMLTGCKAFPGDRIASVLHRIINNDPAPLDATWDPALAAVLSRALSKAPELRFPSVLKFAAELRAAASARCPGDVAPAVTGPTVLSIARGRTTVVALPAVLARRYRRQPTRVGQWTARASR